MGSRMLHFPSCSRRIEEETLAGPEFFLERELLLIIRANQ